MLLPLEEFVQPCKMAVNADGTPCLHIKAAAKNANSLHSLNINEGQTTLCDTEAIVSLAHGANPAQLFTEVSGDATGFWHLTRHNGKLQIKCWMAPDEFRHFARGELAPGFGYMVTPYSNRTPGTSEFMGGNTTVPITVPLRRFASLHTITSFGRGSCVSFE